MPAGPGRRDLPTSRSGGTTAAPRAAACRPPPHDHGGRPPRRRGPAPVEPVRLPVDYVPADDDRPAAATRRLQGGTGTPAQAPVRPRRPGARGSDQQRLRSGVRAVVERDGFGPPKRQPGHEPGTDNAHRRRDECEMTRPAGRRPPRAGGTRRRPRQRPAATRSTTPRRPATTVQAAVRGRRLVEVTLCGEHDRHFAA